MNEIREVSGHFSGAGRRFGIVAARFNSAIVEQLVAGATDCLLRHGTAPSDVTLVRVPGAWEIPQALDEMAAHGGFSALVALGAVIRGETPHFEMVCAQCCQGIDRVSVAHRIPIGFGVLTCDTVAQAADRAGGKAGNKGFDAAMAALEMSDLLPRLRASALMQGLADGYFVIPYTIGDYLATSLAGQGRDRPSRLQGGGGGGAARVKKLLSINGQRTVDSFHRELGKIMWEYCGMARIGGGPQDRPPEDPRPARGVLARRARAGRERAFNQSLEKAGRVADFLELGGADVPGRPGAPRVLRRPLPRRVPDAGGRGPARRRALRPRRGLGVHGRRARRPSAHQEPLEFEYVHPSQRSYK